MKPIVTLEYKLKEGHWTWIASIDNGKPVKGKGDLYPGTPAGLKAAKRDAAAAIAHLRGEDNIKVKRT